jgi:hypothetical protein
MITITARCFVLTAACAALHGADPSRLPLPVAHADTLHCYLKWACTLWAVLDLNAVLNRWAENRWLWRDDTGAWDWEKEIAVVTGGAQGIGACVVKNLLSHGISCAVLDVAPLSASYTKRVPSLSSSFGPSRAPHTNRSQTSSTSFDTTNATSPHPTICTVPPRPSAQTWATLPS